MNGGKNQKLIMLRGPRGTGKSAVAEKLRDIGKDKVWLHVDRLGHFFPQSLHQAHSLHYKTAKNLAEFFLYKGFSVVADGMFEETEWVNWFVDLAKKKRIDWKVFEFVTSVDDIIKRDRKHPGVKQGWRKPIRRKSLERQIRRFRENSYPEAIQIDTSEKTVKEVVEFILSEVGWKEELLGKLQRYLS